jgi:hypothetical protein
LNPLFQNETKDITKAKINSIGTDGKLGNQFIILITGKYKEI